jgi:eukaryotic-like serine/threonine-protein kinase
MTSEEWIAVKEAFEASRSLSAPMRDEYLSHNCTSEATRAEVESLLAAYAGDAEFLEEPALASHECGSRTVPEFVGCYQIRRSIGEGGMSNVYEGYRRDGHFQQRVAIKVLKRGMDTATLLLRFRTERQILAEFRHPHTAQLFDGGALPDGRPFLVMEYVEGEPITELCDHQKLSIERRLDLFLQVCSAVQAAHQNLIVHRDIKPSNILVTAEGDCKLLDFGIAKILEPARYQRTLAPTMASERLLTPEYASPEQVRGESITTASDVYSLGVLLYELVAGRSPYNFESRQLDVIARSMEAQVITSPSAAILATECCRDVAVKRSTTPAKLRKTLRGDLDNIVLRALRKEPGRRYQSVEQMADDIRSYQHGLPVSARKETLGYLASKFFARNKAVSFVAILLLLAILAGTSEALWQAHRAERERARAERRFSEIRKVANSLIFELHAAILPLRGSREAQELILRRATEMLDGLAREADNDPALDLELASGYRRLGDAQGNPLAVNRGDKAAAMKSYREALRLGKAALAKDPTSREAKRDLASSYQNLSSIAGPSESESAINAAIQLHSDLLSNQPSDWDRRVNLGVDYQRRGALRSQRGDFAGAMEDQRRSLDLLQEVAKAHEADTETLGQLSFAHKRVGALLLHENRFAEALKEYQASLAIDERLTAAHPNDAIAEYNKTFAYGDMGVIYRMQGNFSKAVEYQRKALAIREAQSTADPGNVRARQGIAHNLSNLAFNLRDLGDRPGALNARLRAAAILHDFAIADHNSKSALDKVVEEENWALDLVDEMKRGLPKTGCSAGSRPVREDIQRAHQALQSLNPSPDIRLRLADVRRTLARCDYLDQ